MHNRRLLLAMMSFVCAPLLSARGQVESALKMVKKIPMPNLQERLDHLSVDATGKRLFIAALGDKQNTVEVVDLKSNKRIASIPGQSKPQVVFYSPDFKKLFVANGTDGTCKVFTGHTFKLVDNLAIGTAADHVGYDPKTKYLYVAIGDAKSGALSSIDTRPAKHVWDIKTDGGPAGIKFHKSNSQIYVTLAGSVKLDAA